MKTQHHSLFLRAFSWAIIIFASVFLMNASAESVPPTARGKSGLKSVGNPDEEFTRYVEDKTSCRLETAVASYINNKGVTVDLIGAVHVGDKDYYHGLNDLFTTYDALLFEMVGGHTGMTKEDFTEKAGRKKSFSVLRGIQNGMASVLDLSYQLQEVDYTAKNFIHADMDARQFTKRQEERGEGFLQMILKAYKVQIEKMLTEGLKEKGDNYEDGPSVLELIELATQGKAAPHLKRMMGREMSHMEDITGAIEGPDGSVILSERNKVALKVLERELRAGKSKVGIFYGAAHLPDMEKRLLEMGFKPKSHLWLTAWFIPKKDLEIKR